MSHAALHSARPARSALTARVVTTRRWAIGVLAISTLLLVAYLVLVVALTWFFASTWNGLAGGSLSIDLFSVAADVAPALLVGWCTGLATSAALTGGESLGPRTAGIVAGVLGSTAGAALLALTGLL